MSKKRWIQFNAIVDDTTLSQHEKLLLLTIFRFVSKDKGYAYPSQATLQKLSGITNKQTFYKVLKLLETKGYFRKESIRGKGCKYFILIGESEEQQQEVVLEIEHEISETTNEVVEYLNKVANKDHKVDNEVLLLVKALLSKYTKEDIINVIDFKTREWLHDDKMNNYLRPKTLFNLIHFIDYLKEYKANKPATSRSVGNANIDWDKFYGKPAIVKANYSPEVAKLFERSLNDFGEYEETF